MTDDQGAIIARLEGAIDLLLEVHPRLMLHGDRNEAEILAYLRKVIEIHRNNLVDKYIADK